MAIAERLLTWRDRTAFRLLQYYDRLCGNTAARLATKRCAVFPDPNIVDEPSLYITQVGHLRKWVSFRCPGKCGKVIRLRLALSESPHWDVDTDWLGRATISPSVRQLTDCGCHFWVRRGRVQWCPDTPPSSQSNLVTHSDPNISRTQEGYP